jgi:hypothetical protein
MRLGVVDNVWKLEGSKISVRTVRQMILSSRLGVDENRGFSG